MLVKALLGATTSFILNGGAIMLALKGLPDTWQWIVIGVTGLMASAKHINAIYVDPKA